MFNKQTGFKQRQWPRDQNNWRPNSNYFQQPHPAPPVPGGLPLSANRFDPLTTDNESDPLVIPPPPTTNQFVNALLDIAVKQAQGQRGRNSNKDSRLKARGGPAPVMYVGETSKSTEQPSGTLPNKETDPTTEKPTETIPYIEAAVATNQPGQTISDRETATGYAEPGSSRLKGAEADDEGDHEVEPIKHQGRTPKKKGDPKRRKSRSKSRSKDVTGS